MTFYSEIFDLFLSKITDLHLLENFTDEEINQICIKLLNSAVVNFNYCRISLEKNDTQQMFYEQLSFEEKDMLSEYMVLEWIKPFVNNRLNLINILGDKEFKMFSQANHLKTLIELKEKLEVELERKKMRYSWKGFSFADLNN